MLCDSLPVSAKQVCHLLLVKPHCLVFQPHLQPHGLVGLVKYYLSLLWGSVLYVLYLGGHIFNKNFPARTLFIYAQEGLVKEAEHPQGDMVSVTDLRVVNGEEAVGDIFDLVEGLTLAPHLEEPLSVNNEISGLGIAHLV